MERIKARILVVEDESVVALDIKMRLIRLGYEVSRIVSTGADAISAAQELKPNLVLMDISLKGPMLGTEAAQKIHDMLDIPIVFLTAHADDKTLGRAKMAEPFGYITKPFEGVDLRATIEIALYKAKAEKERKELTLRLQKALDEISISEENHRRSMDESPLGIAIVTGDGEVLYANRAILDFYGYGSIEDLRATSMKERYTAESYAEFLVRKEKRQRGEHVPSQYEISIVRKGGEIRHLTVSRKETIWNGKPEYQAIYQDITESSRVENALLQAYSELSAIFSASSNSMLVINRDYTIQLINKEAMSLFGFARDTVRGKKCYETLDTAGCTYYQTSRCPIAMILSGEEKVERECHQETGCCSAKEHLLTAYPFTGAGDDAAGIVLNLKDMAEMNRNRQQVQDASLLASLGEMVAGIAHEVNNPLGSILLYSELLLASDTAAETRKDLRVIRAEAKRAAGIMTKLLTYARSSPPRRRRMNLLRPLRKVLELRRYQQKVHNITAAFDTANEALNVKGNSGQMMQVFMNLIINAEDALKEKGSGKIIITAERDHNWARVSVADNGKGISAENLRRIFHPFFTTKEIGVGTGLGLSVCYGIVTSHGGVIRVENNAMGGATFVVELPLAQSTLGLEEGTEQTGDVDR